MKELTLYLDDLTPDTLSMKRLAEYLRALAILYGKEDAVHFDAVDTGSAKLRARVEDNAYPEILNQVREVSGGLGAKKPSDAYRKLADLMAEDKTGASLRTTGGAKILQFPKPVDQEELLRIVKPSSVQGRLYSVGGKDDSVPVRLEGANGETLHCEASIDMAEKLAHALFKSVRLVGDGEWIRRQDGWKLVKLRVSDFTKIDDSGFKDAVAKLKAAGGIKWNEMPEGHSEILGSRG